MTTTSSDDATAASPPRHYLLVGTPCYGGNVNNLYMTSIMQLQKFCLARGIQFELQLLSGDALITRARNSIVTKFLDTPAATHLMFIDADIGFDAEAVFRMINFNVDLVGGIYPTKNINWELVRRNIESGTADPSAASMNYVVEFADQKRIDRVDHFARAKYLGNGFMLIKRRVFEVMKQRYPGLKYDKLYVGSDSQIGSPNRYAFFDSIIDDGSYLPEDYTFCKRWIDAGGEIWADIASKLTHVGAYSFIGNTAPMFQPIM